MRGDVCAYVYLRTFMRTCAGVYVRVCGHVCVPECARVRVCMCVSDCVCVRLRVRACAREILLANHHENNVPLLHGNPGYIPV